LKKYRFKAATEGFLFNFFGEEIPRDMDLNEKLRAWKVKAEAPVRFQADVWQRIASRAAMRNQSFARRAGDFFSLPAGLCRVWPSRQ
jgi:hypothetical protein